MFHIERSARTHMIALGYTPGNLKEETTVDAIKAVEEYKGLVAESMSNLHEAILGDSTLENKSFAICHAIWSLASLGVAYGLPMNSLWQEYNRAVMTLIDPRTEKIKMIEGCVVAPEGHKDMNLLEVLVRHGMPAPVETFQQLGLIETPNANTTTND